MNCITFARGLAAAVALAAAALAYGQTDVARCSAATGNPDQAIQICTRAIESGGLSGGALALLHYSRGIQWSAKGVYDRAITDYDDAIRINPKFGEAHYSRGNAWSSKGESDRAIADFDAAIRLNPGNPAPFIARAVELTVKGDYGRAIADYDAAIARDGKSPMPWLGRGRTRFYSGDFTRSAADFEQSLKLDSNSYTPLWLFLARKRGGALNAEEMLDSETREQRRAGWPSALIVLYLGRTDLSSVLAASTDKDPRKQAEQRCEANFYLAQWYLLRGDREHALPMLKEAQAGCPREFLEYEGTVAELRRLQR